MACNAKHQHGLLSHDALPLVITHTHTLCDHPPERTTYYNWVGRLLPLRTAYHYWLVHRATLQPKNRQTQRMQGRGKGGGQKKAATNALLEIDSRRQQYTSNMLHARENTVINYYSILIIVVGRKLHNEKKPRYHRTSLHSSNYKSDTNSPTYTTITQPIHKLDAYTHTHFLTTTTRILNQQKWRVMPVRSTQTMRHIV